MNNTWRNPVIWPLVLVCAVFLAGRSGAQDLQPGKTFRDCPECPEMAVIPAGKFLMGTSIADYKRDLAILNIIAAVANEGWKRQLYLDAGLRQGDYGGTGQK